VSAAINPPGLRPRTQAELDDSAREDYWIYSTRYALDYYVSGRFAVAHQFNPVSANILHHAVELMLKACLSRKDTLADIRRYRKIYGHKLDRLWQEFKRRQSSTVDPQFDSIVEALDHFEDIRYPDRLIREGAHIAIGIFAAAHLVQAANNISVPYYELMLPQIDRLMGLLFVAVEASPDAFLPRITENKMALQYYEMIRSAFLGRAGAVENIGSMEASRVSEKSGIRAGIKVAAGTVICGGLIFGFIERLYAPDVIVSSQSTILPAWIGWLGWSGVAAAAVLYFLVDILEWRRRRRKGP
jgi:hypothetical protein